MKNLQIKIISDKEEIIWGLRSYIGEIIIGEFRETFEMPIEFWSLSDYQNQWDEALKRIMTNSESCLVTRVEGYEGKPVQIEWWLLYRQKNQIIIRNQLLISKNLIKVINEKPFTPQTCYFFIPPYRKKKDVEEWITTI